MKPTSLLGFVVLFAATGGVAAPGCTMTDEDEAQLGSVEQAQRHRIQAPAPIDLVLSETLVLHDGQVLDCYGGTIRPSQEAYFLDRGAPQPAVYVSSEPDTLVYVEDAQNVVIRNCFLRGGSFGIYVVGGGHHVISDNFVEGWAIGVSLLDSDHNRVVNNVIEAVNVGILVAEDSDHTLVRSNEVTGLFGGQTALFPGPSPLSPAMLTSDTRVCDGRRCGLWRYMIATWASFGGVSNVIVNGQLRQVPVHMENFTDHTVVTNNTIYNNNQNVPGLGGNGIGFAVRSRRSVAAGNTVQGDQRGLGLLAAGYGPDEQIVSLLPGHCSLDASRLCGWDPRVGTGRDADCNIPGYDEAPLGECVDAVEFASVPGTWQSRRVGSPRFVGNTARDLFLGAAMAWPDQTFTFEGNDLLDNCVGLEFGNYALELGAIQGNFVASDRACGLLGGTQPNVGFVLANLAGAYAGVDVSNNDAANSGLPFFARQLIPHPTIPGAVIGQQPYTIETTFHDNYWGGCDAGGFPMQLPDSVFPGAPRFWWPNTTDESPAAEPIALAWRAGDEDAIPRCP